MSVARQPARHAGHLELRSARRGLRLGIVSNAQFYTPLFFEVLLGGRPGDIGFTDSLCVYSFESAAAKPGPELFARAARGLADLGIEAGQAVMVGNDPDNDIAAAARCGFMTVRIGGNGGPPADAVIHGLTDLEQLARRALRAGPGTPGSGASAPGAGG